MSGWRSSWSETTAASYDQGMPAGFPERLPRHLNPGGEAWLIMSDLAERLGLRGSLSQLTEQAGLRVTGRQDTRPRHRVRHGQDPFAVAKADEIVSLWRLEQAHLHGADARLESAAGIELDHRGRDVPPDGADTDTQAAGDGIVRQALGQHA